MLQGMLIADGVLLLVVIVIAIVRFSRGEKQEEIMDLEPVVDDTVALDKEEETPTDESTTESEQEPPKDEALLTISDLEEDKSLIQRLGFADKMESIDEETKKYYESLDKALLSYDKIKSRVSKQGASYMVGRTLVAKMTVRGKTLRLHLALDVSEFNDKIYFQKNFSDVKAYKDVPFTVKVKSEKDLKRANDLIIALAQKNELE